MTVRFSGRIWALVLGLLLVLAGIVLQFPALSNLLARTAWEDYRLGRVALALNAKDAQLAFDIGNRAFGLEFYDIPLAKRAFKEAVELDPKMLGGHYQLARVLFVEGEFDEALANIELELKHNPANLRALYVRGLIYAYNNQLAAAEEDFRRFVAWAPTEWAGHNDYAWVLAQEGKYAEAKTALEQAFKVAHGAETNPWLWNNLGVQELNLRNYAPAAAAFEKAKKLMAELPESDWRAAYPGNDPTQTQQGIDVFKNAIEQNLTRAQANN